MSKEKLLLEAYNDYCSKYDKTVGRCNLWTLELDQFIINAKMDSEFAKDQGLVIEERELNLDERAKLHPDPNIFYDINGTFSINDSIENSNLTDEDKAWLNEQFNIKSIPTKKTTITYNDKTIESYE